MLIKYKNSLVFLLFLIYVIYIPVTVNAALCPPGPPYLIDSLGGTGGSGASLIQTDGGTGGNSTCATDSSGGGGGGGGGMGASGAGGGHGAGGGFVMKNDAGSITITGSIDARGGSSSTTNGGTVKIFYFGSIPSITGISAGRTFLSTGAISTAPELIRPTAAETGIYGLPTFRFRSSDAESNNLQYKVDICSTSDCSSVVRTIDQSLDQTGWFGQDQAGATAYTGSVVTSGSAIATYRLTSNPLTPSTQYWWRVYAVDVGTGGSNLWSPVSAIQSFTTIGVINTQIGPGSQIIGGGHVQ